MNLDTEMMKDTPLGWVLNAAIVWSINHPSKAQCALQAAVHQRPDPSAHVHAKPPAGSSSRLESPRSAGFFTLDSFI
jgi:hypothetical protein